MTGGEKNENFVTVILPGGRNVGGTGNRVVQKVWLDREVGSAKGCSG